MSSIRRIESSRANGARSRGPKTPEGKLRSSRNATRHGILARAVVLRDESPQAFADFHRQHVERFLPTGGVEDGYIEEMIAAAWRLRRLWSIETETFDIAMAAQSHDKPARYRLAKAFSALATQPELNLIHRYESRLHRMYQRSLATLFATRQLCPQPGPGPTPECQTNPVPFPDTSPQG